MAGITITASREVFATSGTKTTWSAARNATTAGSFTEYSVATSNASAITELYFSGRGGGTYVVSRTYLAFDVSSVPGTINAADLYVYGKGNALCDVRPVKSTAFGGDGASAFVSGDFDSFIGDPPTTYSGEKLWSINSYNVMALNGTAISDMNNNGYLIVMLMGNDYDYPDSAPGSDIDRESGIAFKTTGQEIYLDITYTPAATGYTEIVNSVIPANIGAINGVDTFDIIRVNNAPPAESPWYLSDITTGSSANITALITGSADAINKYPVIDKGGDKALHK